MPPASPAARLFTFALALSLTLSALLFVVFSWRWPLVGDSSLIHYIAFLMRHGWAPYRDFGDMNMPGSYLIELAAMRVFGTGALAWRAFDFTLLALASASFFVITHHESPGALCMTASSSWLGWKPLGSNWLAALFASSLFALIHGRDGLAEGGQRDLTMAVCLIASTALLFLAVRRDWPWAAAAFGLLSGVALTIKPPELPIGIAQLALALYVLRHRVSASGGARWRTHLLAALLGFLIAPAIVLGWLLQQHALHAFFDSLGGLTLYYTTLGHRPLGFLLLHSISPLLSVVLLWLAVLALQSSAPAPAHSASSHSAPGLAPDWTQRWTQDWERTALLLGAVLSLFVYIIQARGFPYYRYSLLAFLLPLMALDLTDAFTRAPVPAAMEPGSPSMTVSSSVSSLWMGSAAQALAALALAIGGLFLAPQSAVLIHRYRWWETDFISTLQQNLNTLGGPALSGRIQCIDSISGCGNVLYRMSLLPATGVLLDFPLFGPGNLPIVQQNRATLTRAFDTKPPQVIVVSSWLYTDGPDGYLKLARWPALPAFLSARYTLAVQWSPTRTARWWSREETPAGYRIYVLRSTP